jgi:hypothetical protein
MKLEYYNDCAECIGQCHGHEKQLTELEKLTESICGKDVTFYSSDVCANCGNYSGYGMPLCDTCEKLPGWNVVR